MTKQLSQVQRINNMNAPFRFRLGAICALKPGPASFPYGEQKAQRKPIKARYSGKAVYEVA